MGLGPLHTISLAKAREKARKCREMRLDGIDPLEERRRQRLQGKLDAARSVSFKDAAETYIRSHQAGWRNQRHAAQWPQSLGDFAFPVFGDLPVQAIDTGLVMKALEAIWTVKPETASRVRGRIEAVLDWAKARGYREGENPARWRGHLENLLPKESKVRRVKHHAALPYSEIGTFMADLRQVDGIAARALEFLVLTMSRRDEVRGAKWNEFNLAERLWVVPGERMKNEKEHRVPLSDAALKLVLDVAEIRHGDHVFPGTKPGCPLSPPALLLVVRRLGHPTITNHGMRACFRSWVAETTSTPHEVAELALAHSVGDDVTRAYQRSDLFEKRRALAEAWSEFINGTEKVVPFRAASR
jgi:integrase